jgi:1-acyl-sn-glycerol-3-phosphate acyltransferase
VTTSASLQEAPRGYRWCRSLFRVVLRVFFRSVEVTGLENVPMTGCGILVAWHPNGVVDGGLLVASMPRQVVFGARHGLFRAPVLGSVLRAIGAVPLFRRRDLPDGSDEDRRRANARSLARLVDAVAAGRFAALFPEGRSHDEPGLVDLKSGAARLFYDVVRASPAPSPAPVIVPVGLHYDKKHVFGSRVLVMFHPPIVLPRGLAEPLPQGAGFDEQQARARELTAEIERVLVEVVLSTESWELHQLLHRIRKIVRAERSLRAGATLDAADMEERVLGFRRVWEGYRHRRSSNPEEMSSLLGRVARYDRVLRALALDDRELDLGPRLGVAGIAWRLVAQVLLIYLVLPPVLILGYLVNVPLALLLRSVGRLGAHKYKGDASIKVLVGAVLFPCVWLALAALVGLGVVQLDLLLPRLPESAPVVAAVLTFLLCALGGVVAMEYHRLAAETWRAMRVRLTRARRQRTIAMMRRERARLHDDVMKLAEGLDLSGSVAADGRIVAAGTGDVAE